MNQYMMACALLRDIVDEGYTGNIVFSLKDGAARSWKKEQTGRLDEKEEQR